MLTPAAPRNRRPHGRLSYVVGASGPPLSERTVCDWLDAAVAALPDRTACVFREQAVRLTWAALHDQSDALAVGLACLGLVNGDRIGIWSPNRVEWLLAQYATARVGVILVNVNPAYRVAELEYVLDRVGAKGIITAAAFKSSDYLAMLTTVRPKLATLVGCTGMGLEPTPGMRNFADVVADVSAAEVAAVRVASSALSAFAAINIQFTSGITGNPKRRNPHPSQRGQQHYFLGSAMGLRAANSLAIPVPLYYCFSTVVSSLACAVTVATMVFPSEGFKPLATLQAVAAERCAYLHGAPTMFINELDHPEFAQFDLSSLRGGIMTGSPCPVAVMQRINEQMDMTEVTIAYGMTETSPVSFQSSIDDPLDKRVTTVGRILPHLEVKLVDAEGSTVPVGTPGDLWTRGYSLMQGYWGERLQTPESVTEGWMHTRDLAALDQGGYCNIVGRVKDMLIRGGETVYPRETK